MSHMSLGLETELLVKAKLIENGYTVLEPLGSQNFDVAVKVGSLVATIQVKSAWRQRNGSYMVRLFGGCGKERRYLLSEVSFFVVRCGLDYFIFPNTGKYRTPTLFPRKRVAFSMERFKNQWNLIRETLGGCAKESVQSAARRITRLRKMRT